MTIDRSRPVALLTLLAVAIPLPVSPSTAAAPVATTASGPRFPFREAGLTERQAVAHLLDRFAFGARPGEIDRVLATGLETWFARQLAGALDETGLEPRLRHLDALALPARELALRYPDPGLLRGMAIDAGVVSEAELRDAKGESSERDLRRKIDLWAIGQGYRPERELVGQMMAAKLLRAAYAENQLREVLTDFWFNHFNVSITDNQSRGWVYAYERDAIRPHVVGSFRALLEATAKHPAMLTYLDNFRSIAAAGQPTTMDGALRARDLPNRFRDRRAIGKANPNRPEGLNENYARELLELHTLGVDGGYTQQDVIEVARAFTGWTIAPPIGRGRERLERAMARAGRAGGLGFVEEGSFLFRADAHDAGAKTVLGTRLPAGRGIEDGEAVLDLVARHPATARRVAAQLAVRFVADDPPAALVDRLAATFTRSGGDLAAVLSALVVAPEFWAPAARAAKIKSPFEVAVSALRALGAEVENPFPLLSWIERMGEPLYAYQAPTGFPDRAGFWVNTGALLTRMNFGLELAAGRIGGVRFDLPALDGRREPESAAAALATYAALLLPERDVAPTVAKLAPLLARPDLARRVADRAPKSEAGDEPLAEGAIEEALPARPALGERPRGEDRDPFARAARASRYFPEARPMAAAGETPTVLAGVVGLVLGSPEFQRR
ncbi:MAG: DUF1800 domain-containing protein [Thermoanaerobaculia bacterium]